MADALFILFIADCVLYLEWDDGVALLANALRY